jgi:ketosteroid isomerase-like protein
MASSDSAALARTFIEDFNSHTFSDIYTPDAVTWHNTTAVEIPRADHAARLQYLQKALPDLRLDDVTIDAWDDGFCVRFTLTGTGTGGQALRVPACGVGTTRDGRIARYAEYIDSAPLAALR